MKSSIAIAAALVLSSFVFNPGSAAARGAGHGPVGMGQSGHGVTHVQPAFFGWRGYGRWGYGPGWCYWHPYVCYRNQ
jgi:hypothetical protein